MSIVGLLESYRKKREELVDDLGDFEIVPSTDNYGEMRTLDPDFFRPLSPMLKERFQFCSSWDNAYLSQNWLSIERINDWINDDLICSLVNVRKENSYPGEPLDSCSMNNISLFSINPYEFEEIYLVWDEGAVEPKVWHYFGGDFYMFNSFERFLLYINGFIGDEDTIRESI